MGVQTQLTKQGQKQIDMSQVRLDLILLNIFSVEFHWILLGHKFLPEIS